jgi:hypothetical protein
MRNRFAKWGSFLTIALVLSLSCFAGHNLKMTYDCTQTSDNYYVQPGGVYVAPDGIFILVEGELVEVNILCSDEKGVYVPASEMSRRLVRCPFCGRFYDPEHPENHKCKGH